MRALLNCHMNGEPSFAESLAAAKAVSSPGPPQKAQVGLLLAGHWPHPAPPQELRRGRPLLPASPQVRADQHPDPEGRLQPLPPQPGPQTAPGTAEKVPADQGLLPAQLRRLRPFLPPGRGPSRGPRGHQLPPGTRRPGQDLRAPGLDQRTDLQGPVAPGDGELGRAARAGRG